MRQSGFGIASLTLGILGIVLVCCGGGFFSVLGIIFGAIGLREKNKNHGTAIAGLICSIVSLIVFIIMLVITSTSSGITYLILESLNEALNEATKGL